LTAIAFLSALVAVAFATILQHIHLPHYLVQAARELVAATAEEILEVFGKDR
jgi:hypothetical protein